MFVSFDLFVFLAWVFISALLPGALLSLSIFRKEKAFNTLEKLFIGFALGFVLQPLIPFLLYILAGVKFSYSIALVSVGLLYAVSIVFLIVSRAYEDFIPKKIRFSPSMDHAVPAALIIILLLTYLVRIGSYSPVFYELDPYYYTYTASQLLMVGENPVNDTTAWYPEVTVNHRIIPEISYLEATWYTLYTGGASYDNMLLAIIASMYPPIAAVLAVFFVYLLVSVATKREWGVVAAGLTAFVPIFVYKLSAGEQEVQPYAFFALAFFYSMYALSIKRTDIRLPSAKDLGMGKDIVFPVLAGLALAALAMGSASQILAIVSLIIFILAQSLFHFLRDEDNKELRRIIIMNSVILVIGPFLASTLIKPFFENGTFSFSILIAFLVPILFAGVLYALNRYVPDRKLGMVALASIIIVGLAIYATTPLGDYVRNLGKSGFEIAQFNTPLDRTIAEQGGASTVFDAQIGFLAQSYSPPASIDTIGNLLDLIFFIVLAPFSMLANLVLAIFVGLVNLFLGTSVPYDDKAVSFLLFWLVFFWSACIYSAWKFMKREDDVLSLFFLAIVMPPLVVGLIKAKYTIYSGVLLAIAVAYAFGKIGDVLVGYIKKVQGLAKDDSFESWIPHLPLAICVLLVILQFFSQGYAPALVWGSFQTLYQNNPDALAHKFQLMCNQTGDSDVCAAASDPMGYASLGTNYQYSSKLCMLSIFSNYSYLVYKYDGDPSNDALVPALQDIASGYRCQRMNGYWIDSMEWIKNDTEQGARIISWWDYGHWINFFGERNAVIRNEHASHDMIGAVAHSYLDSTPEELKDWMEAHDSKYALFDIELVYGGGGFGGKYSALNYLACAWDNQTNVNKSQGESQCEAQHLWESVFVAASPCTISSLTGKTGITAYKVYEDVYEQRPDGSAEFMGTFYRPYYPPACVAPTDPRAVSYCSNYVHVVPTYCVGNVTLATGDTMYGTYYLNETYPNGDLKLNKGLLEMPYNIPYTLHLGNVTEATLVYTEHNIWLENGVIKSGYEDRKGKFYDSALYRAIFLDDLPGFEKVYQTSSGEVKIYKIADTGGGAGNASESGPSGS